MLRVKGADQRCCAVSPVGCLRIIGDERQPYAWQRLHAKAAQHFHMAVPPTNQNQVLPMHAPAMLLERFSLATSILKMEEYLEVQLECQ